MTNFEHETEEKTDCSESRYKLNGIHKLLRTRRKASYKQTDRYKEDEVTRTKERGTYDPDQNLLDEEVELLLRHCQNKERRPSSSPMGCR